MILSGLFGTSLKALDVGNADSTLYGFAGNEMCFACFNTHS